MYVTQTYLGLAQRDAKAYVYFLSEAYMSTRQRDLHDVFMKRAKEFGLSTNREVAVMLPYDDYEIQVGLDLQDSPDSKIQSFYAEKVRPYLPGLLVSREPIDTRKGLQNAVFFSFNTTEHPFRAAKAFVELIVSEKKENWLLKSLENFNEIAILQPNLSGVGGRH